MGGEEVHVRGMERERGACAGKGVSVLAWVKEREGMCRQKEGTCRQQRGVWAGGKGEGVVWRERGEGTGEGTGEGRWVWATEWEGGCRRQRGREQG